MSQVPDHACVPPACHHALPSRLAACLQLLSWCDRYWGPVEYCQVPGAFSTRLPFVAPMDHVFGE